MDSELERLGRAVKQAQHRQFRTLERALKPLGTSVVQWDALRAIAAMPDASAHALAVATFQTDQAFGTLATRLEARGMLERSAGEGRRIAHRLTSRGEEMLARADAVADRIRRQLYAGLSAADRRLLLELLQRFVGDDENALPVREKTKGGREAAPSTG